MAATALHGQLGPVIVSPGLVCVPSACKINTYTIYRHYMVFCILSWSSSTNNLLFIIISSFILISLLSACVCVKAGRICDKFPMKFASVSEMAWQSTIEFVEKKNDDISPCAINVGWQSFLCARASSLSLDRLTIFALC